VRRRGTVSRKPAKPQLRKSTRPKRNNAPTAARHRRPSVVDLQKQLDARTKQLNEAIERENATAEVLRVISRSLGDLQPVFDAMLANATRLCEANFGTLYLSNGDAFRAVSLHNAPPGFVEFLMQRGGLIRPSPNLPLGRLARTKHAIHIADIRQDQSYGLAPAGSHQLAAGAPIRLPRRRETSNCQRISPRAPWLS
jgi:two-component system, NtrC family, sensor kinase